MRAALSGRIERRCLAGIVLVAFLLRALIPAGFMPSAERPFSLEFCPASFPAEWLAGAGKAAGQATHAAHSTSDHHHHSTNDDDGAGDSKSGFEHCPFGSAPSAAPLTTDGIAPLAAQTPDVPQFVLPSSHGERLIRSQQARAPPKLS